MKFWKYHGIGNDFVLLDGSKGNLEVDSDLCRRLCDRHFGVGADGVLYLLPGNGTDVTMRIINVDGSEAEMCGNGIRCLAKHAYDFGIVKKDSFTINTLAGNLKADITKKNGKAASVRIDMGAPILDAKKVPVNAIGKYLDRPFEACDIEFAASAVSMGNPHFVTFSELTDEQVLKLGPALEKHKFFPKKTNVEFCRLIDGKIFIKVYERGAAWTLACGTGACAATTVAALLEMVPFNVPVDVHLPGGWLKITVDEDLRYVLMEGPAELVFEGNMEV